MRRRLDMEVKESAEELKRLLKTERDPLVNARIRALYLYVSGQCKDRLQIAKALGYGRNAVGRWFRMYEQGGIDALTGLDKGGNNRPLGIPPEAMAELVARLDDPHRGFSSYKEAWEWLRDEHGLELTYVWVNEIIRDRLKAGLKVPRKSSIHKKEGAEERFKKTGPAAGLPPGSPLPPAQGRG